MGRQVKLEVWSMKCEHCGEDMQPRFIAGELHMWWCLGCSHTETPEHALNRATDLTASDYQIAGCEVCDE